VSLRHGRRRRCQRRPTPGDAGSVAYSHPSREERVFLSQVGAGPLNGVSGYIRSRAQAPTDCSFSHLAVPMPFYKPLYTRSHARRDEAAMRVPDHPTLIRRMLDARLRKLATHPPVLARAPLWPPHLPLHYGGPPTPLTTAPSRTGAGRAPSTSPKTCWRRFRSWVAQHQRRKALLREIHDLSIALVRTHVTHRRRQRGGPDRRPGPGPHRAPLLPRRERLARPAPRYPRPGGHHL